MFMRKNATVFALMLCTSSLGAEETPADLLARAWEEYGLQAFSNADALFADAARIARGEAPVAPSLDDSFTILARPSTVASPPT